MDNFWLPFASGIATALVGSTIAPLLVGWWQRRTERRNLRAAFSSEVAALLEIVKKRRYIEDLEAFVDDLRRTGGNSLFTISVTREFMPVFRSHAANLGLLKVDEAKKLTTFYMLGQGLLEDLDELRTGKRQFQNSKECIDYFEGLLDWFKSLRIAGTELTILLNGDQK